jgi:electron transport complex protein RnfD
MIQPGPLSQTLPPHMHSSDSPAKRYWLKIASLIPLLIVTALVGGLDFLRLLFLSVMSVTGFEWLASGILKKKDTLASGEAFLTGIIFAFLLPAKCPSTFIVLGAFVMVFLLSMCFGGLGSRLFHTAVFGRIFLQLSFPWVMGEAVLFHYAGVPWVLGMILLTGAFFLLQRQTYFEMPVLFIIIFLTGAFLFGREDVFMAAVGIGVFTATVLLTDFETLPLTRLGNTIFSAGAALIAIFLAMFGIAVSAVGYAILVMNCLTPWLDVWLKPKAAKGAL